MVPVLSRSRDFSLFLDGTGPGTGKHWSREKVPVPVPKKIGPEKKYRSRYRKKLVPEKSTGPGTGKKWSRKKVPVPVPEKIGPEKKSRSRYRKKFWVPSHSGSHPVPCLSTEITERQGAAMYYWFLYTRGSRNQTSFNQVNVMRHNTL